jgi:[acyl-carrier-protein] S-malonyltransferase
VRWRESVETMKARGITQLTEIGAGKVLTGLAKRIAPEIETFNVGTLAEIEQFAKAVA